jgi:hypothetical protein
MEADVGREVMEADVGRDRGCPIRACLASTRSCCCSAWSCVVAPR